MKDDTYDVQSVKASDRIIIIAPPRASNIDLEHMHSAINDFKSGALVLLHGTHDAILLIKMQISNY